MSTTFLLLLCLTGLPLIFHHEIDDLLGYEAKPEAAAPGTPRAAIDAVGRAAVADHPGAVLLYLSWDTINTLAEPMLNAWKATDLTEMVKPFAGQPPQQQFRTKL